VLFKRFFDFLTTTKLINQYSHELIMRKNKDKVSKIGKKDDRVELDKLWETSWTRRVIIALLAYAMLVLFFLVAKIERPFINAIIPTVGFILATLSLTFIKKVWIKYKK
jgi:hypothetical protein